MPIIAGAFYKPTNTDTKNAVDKLITTIQALGTKEQYLLENKEQGWILAAGIRQGESPAEQVQVYREAQGILAGQLYTKESNTEAVQTLDLKKVQATHGSWLADQYWGRYITAFFNESPGTLELLRDPQGLCTVFFAQVPDGIIFCSELAVLYDIVQHKPSLDWNYLVSFAVNNSYVTYRTPFEGIHELLPGCRASLSLEHAPIVAPFWDPTRVKSQFISDIPSFEHKVIQTFRGCVSTWSKKAEGVCVDLSGGLESSSLVIMLKETMAAHQNLIAVNFAHPQVASSNELAIAQGVADFCNIELFPFDWSGTTLTPPSKTERINKPAPILLEQRFTERLAEFISTKGNYEWMNGYGGDHLFLAPPIMQSVADCAIAGKLLQLPQKIKDISTYYRAPLFNVIKTNIQALARYYTNKHNYFTWDQKTTPWMNERFLEAIDFAMFAPPFLEGLKDLPPAKALHTLLIYKASLSVDHGTRQWGKQMTHPFLSQPMVELALQMPTYQSYDQGYDRIIFRRGMDAFKKNKFVWRRSKGETSGILALAMRNNFSRVCELALEGRFAQNGLINKDLILHHIHELRHGHFANSRPLINLLSAELWCENWSI
jgi:asparagine synthase (glutamine-hydrolysing)